MGAFTGSGPEVTVATQTGGNQTKTAQVNVGNNSTQQVQATKMTDVVGKDKTENHAKEISITNIPISYIIISGLWTALWMLIAVIGWFAPVPSFIKKIENL